MRMPETLAPDRRIAIVVPLFGHSALVFDAVGSVLAQDGAVPFDLILVDDGCPYEQSVVAGAGIASNFDNVYYIRQENRGLSGARNRGIEFVLDHLTQCDGIFLLDADNFLLPFAVKSFRRALDRYPESDWFYPDIVYNDVEFDGDYSGSCSLALQTATNVCEAGSLIRRRLFEAGVRFDETMKLGYEDWDFWLSAAERGFKGRHLPESGFRYRKRPESMVNNTVRGYAEIRAYIERKHGWMREPNTIVTLEHNEAPRYAIALVDRQMIRLTSDPFVRGEELSMSEFDARFWASLARPNANNAGAFIVVTTEATMASLDKHRLLRWAFWDLEVRSASAGVTTLDIQAHADESISTELIGGEAPLDSGIVLASMQLIREACVNDVEDGIDDRLGKAFHSQVQARRLFVPADPQRQSTDRGMRDALGRLIDRLAACPFEHSYASCLAGRSLGTPDRSKIPLLLRNTFGNAVLPPIAAGRDGRVAFVLPRFEFGNVERAALGAARALKTRGYSASLVLLDGQSIQSPDRPASVFDEIYVVDVGRFDRTGPDHQGTSLPRRSSGGDNAKLANLLSAYEVVISGHAAEILGIAALLRQRGVITVSYLQHFDRTARGQIGGQPTAAIAYEHELDLFAGSSQSLCAQLGGLGVPWDKIVKLQNCAGHDIDLDLAKAAMAERSGRMRPLRVLMLDCPGPSNSDDRSAAIMNYFRNRADDVEFQVIATAINRRSELAEAGFAGDAPDCGDGKAAQIYAWADIVLVPSRFDAASLSVIDAMSYGAVPLVADDGAVAELIEDNTSGVILPKESAASDLIEAIAVLASDRGRLLQMSEQAHHVAQKRTWDAAVEDFVRALEKQRQARQAKRPRWLNLAPHRNGQLHKTWAY